MRINFLPRKWHTILFDTCLNSENNCPHSEDLWLNDWQTLTWREVFAIFRGVILSLCIEVCVETTCFDLFYYVSVSTLNHILILNWFKAEKMIFFQISPPGGRLWSSIMRKRENRSQTKTRASTWVILVSTPMFSWSQNLIMSSIFCFEHSWAFFEAFFSWIR